MRSFSTLMILAFLTGLMTPLQARADGPTNPSAYEGYTPYQVLAGFYQTFPQQKVYIDPDKTNYLAGEVIWLKAYLVSAKTHMPDSSSTNLYVELISNRDELVDFLILRLDNGFSNGSIQLPDSLKGGSYQLKAYTNWMNNFQKDFIFLREIYVNNPEEPNYITKAEIRQNTRFNETLKSKQEQMQLAFFPEGGHMVTGLENRLAFKAADALGAGQEAKGTLLDDQGREVLVFATSHDGMGAFSFTPQAGVSYIAMVEFGNGQTLSAPLPVPLTQGYLLRVDSEPENIYIQVSANFDPASLNMSSEVVVFGHTRGQVCYVEKGTIINGSFQMEVAPHLFPEGIAHFTLFDANDTPVAERLAFVRRASSAEEGPEVGYEISSGDSLVVVDLLFDPLSNISPSDASYSLSVVEKFGPLPKNGQNIATYLLLSSDFGSTLTDPWYYFAENTPERSQDLDLLMMTHGWRRFVWKDLLAGKEPEILFPELEGLSLAGQVKPVSSSRETGELTVEVSVGYTDDRKILRTKTNTQGYFAFTGLNYEGAFSALLSVEQDLRGRIYKVNLLGNTRETTSFLMTPGTQPHPTLERGPDWQRRNRPGFFSRLFNRPDTGEDMGSPSMFGAPDQVIYMEDLNVHYTNVFDVIRDRVTGLRVINGEITLRGPSSIRLSNEPIFFIDEVQVSANNFLSVSVNEVERIEVLRGPSTAILGSRGANGALLIYTRRAEHQQQFSYEYQLRGYHVTRDFFISRISTEKYINQEVPRTILWVPNIIPDPYGRIRVRIPYPEDPGKLHFRLEGIDRLGQITFLQF